MSTSATGQRQQRTSGMVNLKRKSVLLALHSEHSTALEEVWRITAFARKRFKIQTRSEHEFVIARRNLLFTYYSLVPLHDWYLFLQHKLEKSTVNECWDIKRYIRGHTIKCNFIEEFWEVTILIYSDLPFPELWCSSKKWENECIVEIIYSHLRNRRFIVLILLSLRYCIKTENTK